MLTSELLSVIDQYVEGAITLEQLEDWLAPRLPLLFRLPLGEPEATDLAAEVELRLAEMSHGDWSEEEFRSLLKGLLQEVRVMTLVYPPEGRITSTVSSNQPPLMVVYGHSELVGATRASVQ